jgi:hypothetical protein
MYSVRHHQALLFGPLDCHQFLDWDELTEVYLFIFYPFYLFISIQGLHIPPLY